MNPSDFPASAPPCPPLHILLAEDNELTAQYGQLLLGRSGHRVSVASNGVQALVLHAQYRFDLILMDLEMPEMGGLEASAAIRAREAGGADQGPRQAATPIIAVTAHMQEAERQACLAGGMDGFLSKPLDPAAIEKLLAEFAHRRCPPPYPSGSP